VGGDQSISGQTCCEDDLLVSKQLDGEGTKDATIAYMRRYRDNSFNDGKELNPRGIVPESLFSAKTKCWRFDNFPMPSGIVPLNSLSYALTEGSQC